MNNLNTKKFALILLAAIIIGGLMFGYAYWKKNYRPTGIILEDDSLEQACQAIEEEVDNSVTASKDEIQSTAQEKKTDPIEYFLHKNITATVFWVGEKASDENDDISNSPSAWDEQWKKHYGGVDSATKRNGYLPSKFCPKENPFYAALPYNDFGKNGEHKAEIFTLVPWVENKNISSDFSVLKNRWIKIMHNGKTAYAQWEDVGPFEEDDEEYVFGSDGPKNKENKNAGIDVSPAVRDYLSLSDIDKVDWQFVEAGDVPDGAWKKIITTSQVFWK